MRRERTRSPPRPGSPDHKKRRRQRHLVPFPVGPTHSANAVQRRSPCPTPSGMVCFLLATSTSARIARRRPSRIGKKKKEEVCLSARPSTVILSPARAERLGLSQSRLNSETAETTDDAVGQCGKILHPNARQEAFGNKAPSQIRRNSDRACLTHFGSSRHSGHSASRAKDDRSRDGVLQSALHWVPLWPRLYRNSF
jgi:hypothetical protein